MAKIDFLDECKFVVDNRCFEAFVDVTLGLDAGAPKTAGTSVAVDDARSSWRTRSATRTITSSSTMVWGLV